MNSTKPYVNIFAYSDSGAWVRRGGTINGTQQDFGNIVSLSEHGSTVVVGARTLASVYRYSNISDVWMPVGGGVVVDERSGESSHVAISGNGECIAIGSPGDDSATASASGRVRLFKVDSATNQINQIGQSLYGNKKNDKYGYSLSLSHDGQTVAIGTLQSNYVKVLSYNSTSLTWEQNDASDIVGNALDEQFGISVSLSADGGRLVVGSARYDEGKGRAAVYQRRQKNGVWDQIGKDLIGEINDWNGFAVSMSPEGDYFGVAALFGDGDGLEDNGRVSIYRIFLNSTFSD